MHLVVGKGAVEVELMLEDLLAHHNIGQRGDEPPSFIVNESLKLISHGRTPVGISQPAAVVHREWQDRRSHGGEVPVLHPLYRLGL